MKRKFLVLIGGIVYGALKPKVLDDGNLEYYTSDGGKHIATPENYEEIIPGKMRSERFKE